MGLADKRRMARARPRSHRAADWAASLRIFARELIGREGGYGRSKGTFIPGGDEPLGPYKGKGNDAEPGLRYADMLDRIMDADISAIRSEYDRACQIEMPGGRTGHGWSEAERFWLGLRASFPNAAFRVEHRMGRGRWAPPAARRREMEPDGKA